MATKESAIPSPESGRGKIKSKAKEAWKWLIGDTRHEGIFMSSLELVFEKGGEKLGDLLAEGAKLAVKKFKEGSVAAFTKVRDRYQAKTTPEEDKELAAIDAEAGDAEKDFTGRVDAAAGTWQPGQGPIEWGARPGEKPVSSMTDAELAAEEAALTAGAAESAIPLRKEDIIHPTDEGQIIESAPDIEGALAKLEELEGPTDVVELTPDMIKKPAAEEPVLELTPDMKKKPAAKTEAPELTAEQLQGGEEKLLAQIAELETRVQMADDLKNGTLSAEDLEPQQTAWLKEPFEGAFQDELANKQAELASMRERITQKGGKVYEAPAEAPAAVPTVETPAEAPPIEPAAAVAEAPAETPPAEAEAKQEQKEIDPNAAIQRFTAAFRKKMEEPDNYIGEARKWMAMKPEDIPKSDAGHILELLKVQKKAVQVARKGDVDPDFYVERGTISKEEAEAIKSAGLQSEFARAKAAVHQEAVDVLRAVVAKFPEGELEKLAFVKERTVAQGQRDVEAGKKDDRDYAERFEEQLNVAEATPEKQPFAMFEDTEPAAETATPQAEAAPAPGETPPSKEEKPAPAAEAPAKKEQGGEQLAKKVLEAADALGKRLRMEGKLALPKALKQWEPMNAEAFLKAMKDQKILNAKELKALAVDETAALKLKDAFVARMKESKL